MRKGVTDTSKKVRREQSETDRNSLGNLDLLNLRLNIQPEKTEACVASGDNQHHRRQITHEPCHSRPSQTYVNPKNQRPVVNDYFLSFQRKKSEDLLKKKSTFLNNAGDSTGYFPFKSTPSGNLKVNSEQVVYESRKVSVLVANPRQTQVDIFSDKSSHRYSRTMACGSGEFSKNSAMDTIMSQVGFSGLGSLIEAAPTRKSNNMLSEYEGKSTSEILDPELNLSRLGYTGNDPIEWGKVGLPGKKDLYLEICRRIAERINPDCVVHIQGQTYNIHLIVMQCYSDLFDGYSAIKKVEILPDKCSATSFNFIYEWMINEEHLYKHLTRENVLEIFQSAKYLKVQDLIEQCWAFVDNAEVFHEDTAFLLYVEARSRNLQEVCELMIPRIQDFFLVLVSTQDFLDLGLDDVKSLLSSNYIRVNSEIEVFMSAVRWLRSDWEFKEKFKYDVLSCVRFGNIAPWQLVDIKRNVENPEFLELVKDPVVCKMIDDGLAYVIIKYWYGQENMDYAHWNTVLGLQEPAERNWSGMDTSYFTYKEFLIYLDQNRRGRIMHTSGKTTIKPHPPMDLLAKANPRHETMSTLESKKQMSSLHPFYHGVGRKTGRSKTANANEEDEVRNVRKIFTPSQNSFALNSLNRLSTSFLSPQPKKLLVESTLFLPDRETILVFGGIDPFAAYDEGKNAGNHVFRYLPDSNRWEHVGSIPEPRNHHSVAFLKGRGIDPRNDDLRGQLRVVDSVWSFDPATKCWYSESSLLTKRKNFGLVVIHQHMYAIGGCNEQNPALDSVERFDTRRGVWQFVASMNHARAGAACVKYRNYIWAAGGSLDLKGNSIVDVVESYDVRADQWTQIKKLNSPRCCSCMFVMSDSLYLIGGIGQNYKDVNSITSIGHVDLWDCNNMSWKTILGLTIPRHGHSVAYVGTQIFVLGGTTTIYPRCLSNVECFCTRRGGWVKGVSDLPISLSGLAAITLPPAMLISDE